MPPKRYISKVDEAARAEGDRKAKAKKLKQKLVHSVASLMIPVDIEPEIRKPAPVPVAKARKGPRRRHRMPHRKLAPPGTKGSILQLKRYLISIYDIQVAMLLSSVISYDMWIKFRNVLYKSKMEGDEDVSVVFVVHVLFSLRAGGLILTCSTCPQFKHSSLNIGTQVVNIPTKITVPVPNCADLSILKLDGDLPFNLLQVRYDEMDS